MNGDVRFTEPVVERFLRDMWFESPRRRFAIVTPDALIGLLAGENRGKRMVRVSQ